MDYFVAFTNEDYLDYTTEKVLKSYIVPFEYVQNNVFKISFWVRSIRNLTKTRELFENPKSRNLQIGTFDLNIKKINITTGQEENYVEKISLPEDPNIKIFEKGRVIYDLGDQYYKFC